ncbi:hypothetical protein FRC14_000068 [Serendipita sp. 396]|nr:hypothetical protein FRC14_000068 [Serendipita sp. 396]KAG8789851.1 hypothetical protein FRC15_000043 [Serendipita sp. 397]KAG8804807.1 hypothetical protein FRC16_000061 [Serendipita sp. 398]KAG8826319.1 hypothetical protein FRC19_009279 [Serendipita sp. 401]KAG8879477.1 hypothetical protein FRC20_000049 [Serendipita sp. 405]KAG9057058.1 hypothetical protein FS842_008720 [Serendipita sp. 407]
MIPNQPPKICITSSYGLNVESSMIKGATSERLSDLFKKILNILDISMALSLFASLFMDKWLPTRWSLPETIVDLTGRTVIITGSNIGLGFEAAKMFYEMNPERLILAVRSVSKGEDAKRQLESNVRSSDVSSSRPKVDVWEIDMASFESVKAFANRCKTELKRIDVFLANAAVTKVDWTVTADGWETGLQTNVLSTFLLATLVAPLLINTGKLPPPKSGISLKPHLVIVVSDVHFIASLKDQYQPDILRSLNTQPAKFDYNSRYQDTKLIDVLLTRQLAEHPQLKQDTSGIVICGVNPGFCRSELMRETPSFVRMTLYALFARTTQEGAKNYLWSSLTNEIPQGSYTSSCAVEAPSSFVRSEKGKQVQRKLWNEVGAVLTSIAPEVGEYWTNGASFST